MKEWLIDALMDDLEWCLPERLGELIGGRLAAVILARGGHTRF